MAVNVIFSTTNGGTSLVETVSHGNASNGDTTTAQTLYLRHDGDNDITGVKMFIREFSGTYDGDATAAADFAELLAWGDDSTEDGFGGFMMNQRATTAFPTAGWPTYSSKSPTGGSVHRTGVGDSELNGITLLSTTGADSDGTLQDGDAPNVRFQVKIQVPIDEDVAGFREWDQVVSFTYTS